MDNQFVIDTFFERAKPFGTPILICQVGSHAYGLNTATSDEDFRGCFMPNIEYLIGLKKVEQIQIQEEDWVCQELRHFIHIIIKQNPTILELLYIDKPIFESDIWKALKPELIKLVTKKAFKPYNAYVQSQIQKLINRKPIGKRAELVQEFGYDCKFASHAARLALQCKCLMETGIIPVRVPEPYRTTILDIKEGKVSKEHAIAYINDLDKESYTAYTNSTLPESCDVNYFENEILIPLLHQNIEDELEETEDYIKGFFMGGT